MITATKIEHAIKVQLYRWYNTYERFLTSSRIQHQLALLADDIIITTPRGRITGKANYAHSLADYKGMKISHTIEDIAIKTQPNGLITVIVNLLYHGIQKDGTNNCLRFTYDHELATPSNQLPLFKVIHLTVGGAFESPTFQDTYPKLRSLALMHYYLFLIEKIQDNATEFQEILTDDFRLNLSPSSILTTIDELGVWLNGVAQKIAVTSHYPKNVAVKKLAHEKYELTVDFDWEGWTVEQQKMTAKTRHIWVIKDKKNDRFAKIQSIEVEQLVPFVMVE